MSTSSLSLQLSGGAAGYTSFLQRAQGIDPQTLVRLRSLSVNPQAIDVFVQTPFEILASRRVRGHLSAPGVLSIADALEGQGPDVSYQWAGALPPETGFNLIDTVPVSVVRELADQGQALARQFSSALGPPKNLLEQTVLTASSDTATVEIPMRLIFGCVALGFIPSIASQVDAPRYLRISQAGRWTRVDAAFGTVYLSRGLPLLF